MELNQNRPHARKWVRFENVCPKSGYSLPLQIGRQSHLFRRLRNLTANLTVYIFEIKHEIHNRASALETTRNLLHHFKISWTLVHKRVKIRPSYLPALRKFWILIHCQASQTEISKRNWTKPCQRWTVNRAINLPYKTRSCPSKKFWPRNVYICSVFRRLRDLTVNIL